VASFVEVHIVWLQIENETL